MDLSACVWLMWIDGAFVCCFSLLFMSNVLRSSLVARFRISVFMLGVRLTLTLSVSLSMANVDTRGLCATFLLSVLCLVYCGLLLVAYQRVACFHHFIVFRLLYKKWLMLKCFLCCTKKKKKRLRRLVRLNAILLYLANVCLPVAALIMLNACCEILARLMLFFLRCVIQPVVFFIESEAGYETVGETCYITPQSYLPCYFSGQKLITKDIGETCYIFSIILFSRCYL